MAFNSYVPFEAPSPLAPIAPDFHSCFQTRGRDPIYSDCARAASFLPRGGGMRQYRVSNDQRPFTLPMTFTAGE